MGRSWLVAACVLASLCGQASTAYPGLHGAKSSFMTLAIIKPDAVEAGHTNIIQSKIISSGFHISQQRLGVIDIGLIRTLYSEHQGRPFYPPLVEWMSSGPSVVMVLTRPAGGAVERWRQVIGPTDPNVARSQNPRSLRAQFGTDVQKNALHGSESTAAALRELSIFHTYLKQKDVPLPASPTSAPASQPGFAETECAWGDDECALGQAPPAEEDAGEEGGGAVPAPKAKVHVQGAEGGGGGGGGVDLGRGHDEL